MRLTIAEVIELPEREVMRWRMYWSEEPWGPYRDNMHAAMIVSEGLRPHVEDPKSVTMQRFMFEHPDDRESRDRLATEARFAALARAQKRKK